MMRVRALKKQGQLKSQEIWGLQASLKMARGQPRKYMRGRKRKAKVLCIC